MRDLDALRSAHLPIHGERGRGGGVHLDKSYDMPPISFSAREALLLLVLGRFAHEMRVMPMQGTLRSAMDKVRAALPIETQKQLARLQKSVSFVGVPAHEMPEAVRDAVETAWLEGSPLAIHYRSAQGAESQRRVRIESVVLERSETLLNCTDLELQQPRQFRMHRIVRATPLDVKT